MHNQTLAREEKKSNIKKVLNMWENAFESEKKKIICLLMFSIFQTPFGCSIIQESERFREVIFGRYELFITDNDQDFVEAMRERRV